MLSHLKRRIGVLTAVAVLAALVPTLAVSTASAAPATTATASADLATLSACPASASIPSAGFTDTTSTDVDCIAYYGITTGVTATTYEPTANIPRWQMALYLTRFLTKAGYTLGTGADQGFTDISGESAEIQTAINQLKQAGVTNGTTATTYSPDDNVTREQMAMFVERSLGKATAGPGGSNDSAAADDGLSTAVHSLVTVYNYTDIDSGSVTYEGHNAIAELYNLGVPGDLKTVTTFSPSAAITRDTMATWLANAAAHTSLRPSGVVIQATNNTGWGDMVTAANELHVSNRDSSFAAVADTIVDVFGYTTVTTADEAAFAASGACKDALEVIGGAEELCLIENTDHVTDQSGNIKIEQTDIAAGVNVGDGESTQYWAWTAAVGTYYSSTATSTTTTVTSSLGGDHLHLTVDKPYANVNGSGTVMTNYVSPSYDAKMGTDTVITLQLRSSTGVTSNTVSQAGCVIDVSSATGTHGGAASAIAVTSVTTDASGTATFTASKTEPTALDANDAATAQHLTFTRNATASNAAGCTTTFSDVTFGSTGSASNSGAFLGAGPSIAIKWDDEVRDNNTVVAATSSKYVRATATGSGATNTVTGTSYDQYGAPMANQSIGLTSTIMGATASTFTTTRTTNSSGVATFGVTRDDATSASESFRVNDDEDNNSTAYGLWTIVPGSTDIGDDAGTGDNPQTYAPDTAAAASAATGEIMASIVEDDVANNLMVVLLTAYNGSASVSYFTEYTWDDNDAFVVNGVAKTLAQWETALVAAAPSWTNQDDIYNGGTNAGYMTLLTTSNVSTFAR